MTFDIVTIFPAMIEQPLTAGILGRAIDRGILDVRVRDLRDFTVDRHRVVDDVPYGGGPGMVLKPDPIFRALDAIAAERGGSPATMTVILTSPQGRSFTQGEARRLSHAPHIVLLCGRYEGFDDRIRQVLQPVELSVGDFVTNGGEVPAMVVIDSVIRLIPGVLGDEQSAADDSHSAPGRIEYPQFTRPRVFRGLEVPEVLLSGNHQAVAKWREELSRAKSKERTEP